MAKDNKEPWEPCVVCGVRKAGKTMGVCGRCKLRVAKLAAVVGWAACEELGLCLTPKRKRLLYDTRIPHASCAEGRPSFTALRFATGASGN